MPVSETTTRPIVSQVNKNNLQISGANLQSKPKKSIGCLLSSILLFLIWLAGGWFLFQGTKNAPDADKDNTVDTQVFEIIPKSTETTFIENNDSAK